MLDLSTRAVRNDPRNWICDCEAGRVEWQSRWEPGGLIGQRSSAGLPSHSFPHRETTWALSTGSLILHDEDDQVILNECPGGSGRGMRVGLMVCGCSLRTQQGACKASAK